VKRFHYFEGEKHKN